MVVVRWTTSSRKVRLKSKEPMPADSVVEAGSEQCDPKAYGGQILALSGSVSVVPRSCAQYSPAQIRSTAARSRSRARSIDQVSASAIKYGIAFLTEDRRMTGVCTACDHSHQPDSCIITKGFSSAARTKEDPRVEVRMMVLQHQDLADRRECRPAVRVVTSRRS